jgi:hypothetical protein
LSYGWRTNLFAGPARRRKIPVFIAVYFTNAAKSHVMKYALASLP